MFTAPQLQQRKREGLREKAAFVDNSTASKVSKKKQVLERGGRDTKQTNFTHPWLVTSLKGHSGRVLDMDFSSNGKYVATCGEGEHLFILNMMTKCKAVNF